MQEYLPVIARPQGVAIQAFRGHGLPRFAFHEPILIANKVKQSRTPEYMDRHALRPRDDDAGSRSVCGISPDSGDSQ